MGLCRGGKFCMVGFGTLLVSSSTSSQGMSVGMRLLVGVEERVGVVMGEIGVRRDLA